MSLLVVLSTDGQYYVYVQYSVPPPWSMRTTHLITGPLWGESTGDRWIPLTKGQ